MEFNLARNFLILSLYSVMSMPLEKKPTPGTDTGSLICKADTNLALVAAAGGADEPDQPAKQRSGKATGGPCQGRKIPTCHLGYMIF